MRIIGGNLKGKKISFLNNDITRPLRDMVKENIFNIILHSNISNIRLKDSNILDLYSGIGSFGIECLSRGCNEVCFVENNNEALDILNKNLKNKEFTNKFKIFKNSVRNFLKTKNFKKFDIIFLDPPYADEQYFIELEKIKELKIFNESHLIVIHREKIEKDKCDKLFKAYDTKLYGRSKIIFGRLT